MQFILPRSSLSSNIMERRCFLDQYFPTGLIPYESLEGDFWKLIVFIPNDFAYYVDPFLEKALQGWEKPISIQSLSSYRCSLGNSMLSFYDAWTVYYWSLAFTWLISKNYATKKFTLIHIDDHLDFDSPHIIFDGNQYKSIFSHQKVHFFDPPSIETSILEKSIGNGSFIAPILHSLQEVNILHLRYSHKGGLKQYGLNCIQIEDSLLAKGEKRPSLKLTESTSKHNYFIDSNPKNLLEKAQESEVIFLHIDCDAFSNRYNLDSNWMSNQVSIDLKLEQIKDKITELLYEVSRLPALILMNVALSPGFFPSEYWLEVTKYIFENALNLGIIKKDDFGEFLKDQLINKEILNGTPS